MIIAAPTWHLLLLLPLMSPFAFACLLATAAAVAFMFIAWLRRKDNGR